MPLSSYLRQRLEEQDYLLDSMERIRREIFGFMAYGGEPGRRHSDADSHGIMLEVLLLLRTIAGPQRQYAVSAEVERQGYPVWSGATPKS